MGRVLRNAMAVLEDLNQNVTYCSAGTLEQLEPRFGVRLSMPMLIPWLPGWLEWSDNIA